MSFVQLVHKPNARSQFDKIDESAALCLFDPALAYERLIDRSKLVHKLYENAELNAVHHDTAFEAASGHVVFIKDDERWQRIREEHAENVGLVTHPDDEDSEVGEDLEEGVQEILARDMDGEDDDEKDAEGMGNVDMDESGNVIGAPDDDGEQTVRGRIQGEWQEQADGAGESALGTRKHSDALALRWIPWQVGLSELNGVVGSSDAGVYARAHLEAEKRGRRLRDEYEDAAREKKKKPRKRSLTPDWTKGERRGSHFYDANGDKRRKRSRTPDWANEELVDAQADLAKARKERTEAQEHMKAMKMEMNRLKRMLAALVAAFPELNMTMRCYTARQNNKRKAETLDADADDVDSREQKRARRDEMPPENQRAAVAAWHKHYRTVLSSLDTLETFPAPPSWPCKACPREARAGRRLDACAHNVGAALVTLKKRELKRCKVLFHPDKFHKCAEGQREVWAAMAEEVFVVVAREAEWRARVDVGPVKVSMEASSPRSDAGAEY